jgi:CDP-glucose 4,6-dehydratase
MESMGLSAVPRPNPAFWANKRVLLTGHTGFKGAWAALWLAQMGAKVTGFALAPETEPSLYALANVERDLVSVVGDLRDADAVSAAVAKANPQIVIHMAAQALVRRSIEDPVGTFATNVQGTAHLLDALRKRDGVEAVLVVTSDKVYANDNSGRAFVESDALGGKDPYSASKAATEMVVRAYISSHFERAGVPLATGRAGNIIGGGDYALDRLVPDTIRALNAKRDLQLRHPEATRPWQHVLECVNGYLLYAEKLASDRSLPRALNFGPISDNPVTVGALANSIMQALGAQPKWQHVPEPGSIEMTALGLDPSLAKQALGWRTEFSSKECVAWTAAWYGAFAEGSDPRAITLEQVNRYSAGQTKT